MTRQRPMTGYRVALRKSRSIWHYFTYQPEGGGFGSATASGGTKAEALGRAIRSLPPGAEYELIVNGKPVGSFRKADASA